MDTRSEGCDVFLGGWGMCSREDSLLSWATVEVGPGFEHVSLSRRPYLSEVGIPTSLEEFECPGRGAPCRYKLVGRPGTCPSRPSRTSAHCPRAASCALPLCVPRKRSYTLRVSPSIPDPGGAGGVSASPGTCSIAPGCPSLAHS
jgi:hypothetical protein